MRISVPPRQSKIPTSWLKNVEIFVNASQLSGVTPHFAGGIAPRIEF
jgi:hypothetical protein